MYRCVVTDGNNNSVTSEAGKVIIAESLSITSQPADANVSVGEKAEFTVTATGSGLTYQWQYSKDGGATWLNTSNKTSKYTLSVAGKYLNGYMYRCVVTDENNNSVTSEAGKVVII